MKNILKLIRWKNLLILAFTLWFVKFCVFDSQIHSEWDSYPLDRFEFFMSIIAAMLVAAAGYLINDVLDQEIDKINKPETRLVGRVYDAKEVMVGYFTLNVVSIFITIYVFYNFYLCLFLGIQILAIFTFFIYTKYLKNRGLLGNLTVAFFSGIMPFGIWLVYYMRHSIPFFYNDTREIFHFHKVLFWISMAYSIFAFLISLMRELVKDMEDREGDLATNCKTFAVTQSEKTVKLTLAIITALSMLLILVFQIYLVEIGEVLFAGNFMAIHIILLVYFLPLLKKAKSAEEYHKLSSRLKIIMVFGILFLLYLVF